MARSPRRQGSGISDLPDGFGVRSGSADANHQSAGAGEFARRRIPEEPRLRAAPHRVIKLAGVVIRDNYWHVREQFSSNGTRVLTLN